MMNIGIFGGTFDPIHYGHINAAVNSLRTLNLNRVIFIPSNIPPHKAKLSSSTPYDRLMMCKLATEDYPDFEVSDIEIKRQGISYTIDTLKDFKKIYNNSNLYFIIGADMFLSFNIFKDYEEIFKLCTLCVLPRDSSSMAKLEAQKTFLHDKFMCNSKILHINKIEISSTVIRNNIRENKSISSLVPKKVEEYIYENNLYRESN